MIVFVFAFIIVFICCVRDCACSALPKATQHANASSVDPRIVGGKREADPSVVMWQALFLHKGMSFRTCNQPRLHVCSIKFRHPLLTFEIGPNLKILFCVVVP